MSLYKDYDGLGKQAVVAFTCLPVFLAIVLDILCIGSIVLDVTYRMYALSMFAFFAWPLTILAVWALRSVLNRL